MVIVIEFEVVEKIVQKDFELFRVREILFLYYVGFEGNEVFSDKVSLDFLDGFLISFKNIVRKQLVMFVEELISLRKYVYVNKVGVIVDDMLGVYEIGFKIVDKMFDFLKSILEIVLKWKNEIEFFFLWQQEYDF